MEGKRSRWGGWPSKPERVARRFLVGSTPTLFRQRSSAGSGGFAPTEARGAHRLHPAPRLVVRQRVIELDGAPQMGEGDVVVAAAVFELARQHLLADVEQIANLVVVDEPRVGHAGLGLAESRARLFRLRDLA